MSHPCDKYLKIEFPWEWAAYRAIDQMNLMPPTAARKQKRPDENKLTDRFPSRPPRQRSVDGDDSDSPLETMALQEGLSIRAGKSGKGRGRLGERKTLRFMPDPVRPKLKRRRYTSWLPERSDKVTKHEMQLAKIAKLMWRGWKTSKIAKVLNLSERTARRNVRFLLNFSPEMGRKQRNGRKPAKSRTLVREEYSYAAD